MKTGHEETTLSPLAFLLRLLCKLIRDRYRVAATVLIGGTSTAVIGLAVVPVRMPRPAAAGIR